MSGQTCVDPCPYFWGAGACSATVDELDGNPLFFPIDGDPNLLDDAPAQARIPPQYAGVEWPWEAEYLGEVALHNFLFTTEIHIEFEYDAARTQRVALINESLARRVFPNEDPIGKRGSFGAPRTEADWREIIGVVGDVRHHTLEIEPEPRAYDLFEQSSSGSMFVALRTAGDPARLAQASRQEVRELEPEAPVYLLATMNELVA